MAGNRYILLVEDNPRDESVALEALGKAGFAGRLSVAHDGIEALDQLHGTPVRDGQRTTSLPAALLLDLELPRIDGFEVLRRVRAEPATALLPIVIFTASRIPADIREAYRLGANSYVTKPVEPQRLADLVVCIARYWLTLNEPAGNGTHR